MALAVWIDNALLCELDHKKLIDQMRNFTWKYNVDVFLKYFQFYFYLNRNVGAPNCKQVCFVVKFWLILKKADITPPLFNI
jgi:hypothetical protein